MTIASTTMLFPRIPDREHKLVAEILACCDPDPIRRREHRRQKLASFPSELQPRVREIVNKVITARSKHAN